MMFRKKDMIDFADKAQDSLMDHNSCLKPDSDNFERIFNEWLDTNPRLITTKETQAFEFTDVNNLFPWQNAGIVMPVGTELRLMQCDVPEAEYVVCDIVGSPEEKYYWIQLDHTTKKASINT